MRTMERFSLDGRVAIVTGGTRGLGAGFARALGEAGAKVVIGGRDDAAGAAQVAALGADGIEATYVRGDVTVTADVEALLASALAAYGRVDMLVNNAGARVHAAAHEVRRGLAHVIDMNYNALLAVPAFGRHLLATARAPS